MSGTVWRRCKPILDELRRGAVLCRGARRDTAGNTIEYFIEPGRKTISASRAYNLIKAAELVPADDVQIPNAYQAWRIPEHV